MKAFMNVDDIPVLCENVPDYRKEAFEEAKKMAEKFAYAYIMYNGLYYHVTVGDSSRIYWERKGYKVIHIELSEAVKRKLQKTK